MNDILTEIYNINNHDTRFYIVKPSEESKQLFYNLKNLVGYPEVADAINTGRKFVLYNRNNNACYIAAKTNEGINILSCFAANATPASTTERVVVIDDGKATVYTSLVEEKFSDINFDDLFGALAHNKLIIKVTPQICGCACCKEIFESSEITEYTKETDGSETAICPYCGADSVLPQLVTPVPITKDLLAAIGM